MKKRFLWLLLAFSLLTSQVCSTVAYANLVVDVETVDVPDVGGKIAPPSVPMTGVELETEGEHTETSTIPQPADSVQPTADPQPEEVAEPVENASSSEISVDGYDALIKAMDQINAETDDAEKSMSFRSLMTLHAGPSRSISEKILRFWAMDIPSPLKIGETVRCCSSRCVPAARCHSVCRTAVRAMS